MGLSHNIRVHDLSTIQCIIGSSLTCILTNASDWNANTDNSHWSVIYLNPRQNVNSFARRSPRSNYRGLFGISHQRVHICERPLLLGAEEE